MYANAVATSTVRNTTITTPSLSSAVGVRDVAAAVTVTGINNTSIVRKQGVDRRGGGEIISLLDDDDDDDDIVIVSRPASLKRKNN
jgi:hypothetical protein